MLTCYDYMFAKILNATGIDALLVGDSVAQVIYGYPNTIGASVENLLKSVQVAAVTAADAAHLAMK